MRRRLPATLGLGVVAIATTGGTAPSAPLETWTLVEARAQLASAQPFTAVDATQADRPHFWIRIDRVHRSSVRPSGKRVLVQGVPEWRIFRYAGRASDLLSGTRPKVAFTFAPRTGTGLRIRDFRGPAPDTSQPSLPVRGAFYYPWFPELWAQGGVTPFSRYRPSLGFYSSGDPAVLQRHVAAMRYGRLDMGIWSWWGIGTPEDVRFPTALGVARPTPFRWAIYYEREGYGNPDPDEIRRDLTYIVERYGSKPGYLRIEGRPVVFVYSADDVDCSVADRWARGNPGGAYVVLKVFGGFSECASQPAGWHQYGASFSTGVARHEGYATTIMPGFWFVESQATLFPRNFERWREAIRALVASGDPLQLIVSFNEWGEGTAVESAEEWATPSGYGAYLDALHEELGARP